MTYKKITGETTIEFWTEFEVCLRILSLERRN